MAQTIMHEKDIERALFEMWDACYDIQDEGACDYCPLIGTCLQDSTFDEVADSVTAYRIKEFMKVAESARSHGYTSREEYRELMLAEEANLKRSELSYDD